MSELKENNREYDVDEDYDCDFEESDEYQEALSIAANAMVMNMII